MGLFESFSSMNRNREDRLLEHNSLRKVFVTLLLLMFLLGANAALTAYTAFRLHRFDWSKSPTLLLLIILVMQLSRTIYRQLGR
jgi:uncharacterized membrane protein YhaH (DUF805 family)